jgi:Ca2+-binding EF-hand superfamily protein
MPLLPILQTKNQNTPIAPQKLPQTNTIKQASTNYKEAFSLFDKRGTGRVALASLGDLLRACGQNPTLAEIGELEKSVGGDCEFFISPIFPFRSHMVVEMASLGER